MSYGIFFGHFYPPHRGHLQAIFNAANQCEHLFVIVSNDDRKNERESRESGIKVIPKELRLRWMSQEVKDLDFITALMVDETDIPPYPDGFERWVELLLNAVKSTQIYKTYPKEIEFYCGPVSYADSLKKYGRVNIYDIENSWYPIKSSEIRKEPFKHWDYILGSARSFFARRVLITGTESTGKTSLTKQLAKLYHTSWSYEVGRFYCDEYMGSNEEIYNDVDFMRLAHLQYEKDEEALRNSNRVCFFDTDAVVTQYYSELYLGHKLDYIENFARPERYDLVLMLKPDIPWIADGKRLNGDTERRWQLHEHLKKMYLERGFVIHEIGGGYKERMEEAVRIVNESLNGYSIK